MSAANITKYQNGTGLFTDKIKEPGLSLLQTALLSFTIISSIVLVLSLVYYMIRQRSLDELRHRLVPLYHFDPGECEDWEDELLEDSKKEIFTNGHKSPPAFTIVFLLIIIFTDVINYTVAVSPGTSLSFLHCRVLMPKDTFLSNFPLKSFKSSDL